VDAFEALGGEVPATARIEKETEDMTSVLTEFAAAMPEGIFFPIFEEEGTAFVKQARMFDSEVTLISGAALFVSSFLSIPQSEGVYMVGPETDFGSNVNVATGKNADEVLAAYQAQYGTTPASPYWAHAYDATTLLLSAIRSVAMEVGGKLYIDRLALREELGATAGFQALIAELTCDDFGDCAPGRINIHHHNDLSITDPAQVEVVYRFSP
jgi:ABC-type branched-subunit amino acid transport system substrate-binding protein